AGGRADGVAPPRAGPPRGRGRRPRAPGPLPPAGRADAPPAPPRRRAPRLGLKPCVTTNGSTLTDRLVDSLLEAGLHRLTISLQTPDEKSFAIRGARN